MGSRASEERPGAVRGNAGSERDTTGHVWEEGGIRDSRWERQASLLKSPSPGVRCSPCTSLQSWLAQHRGEICLGKPQCTLRKQLLAVLVYGLQRGPRGPAEGQLGAHHSLKHFLHTCGLHVPRGRNGTRSASYEGSALTCHPVYLLPKAEHTLQ